MYREIPPPPHLRTHLACLWVSSGPRAQPVQPPSPVVPDGCTDIMWIDGRLVVAGPDDAPFLAGPDEQGSVVAVRFRPGRSAAVLGLPLSEIRNQRVALELLWGPGVAEVEARLAASSGPGEQLLTLTRLVAARVAATPALDPVVTGAALDLAAPSPPSVRTVADRHAVSERHLRRRITTELGYGPATFVRIMRFQRAMTLLRAGDRPLADVAATAGYADQAHLTREVRDLAGRTPGTIVADAFKTEVRAQP